jgi:hypothetical protein
MNPSETEQVSKTSDLVDDASFQKFLLDDPHGILIVADNMTGHSSVPVDTGDFVKWVKQNSLVNVQQQEAERRIDLRANEYWLPLVYLANDVSLQVYLGLVTNWLYDKMKGALKGEKARIRMRVAYEDKKAGSNKLFEFEGDPDALQSIIKKFDVNEFMHGSGTQK